MTSTKIYRTIAEISSALTELPATARVGLVPTMGALHEGHGALFQAATEDADFVIASLFVNPLQFNDDADYRNYPRQLEADLEILNRYGVDVVFAPSVEEMYPGYPLGPLIQATSGALGLRWEGAARPGHFDGVVTVVNKLFNILRPPTQQPLQAWFGEKDAEQVAIVTAMVRDFNHPVQIRTLPIVRDSRGLALSSRNQRLLPEHYEDALKLSAALGELVQNAADRRPLNLEAIRHALQGAPGVELDYLHVVDPVTLLPLGETEQVLEQPALALIAATVGPVRLIDNMMIQPGA